MSLQKAGVDVPAFLPLAVLRFLPSFRLPRVFVVRLVRVARACGFYGSSSFVKTSSPSIIDIS